MWPDDPSLTQTDWSMIRTAIGSGEAAQEEADAAMERLARRYWPAVYAFIRRTGRDVHQAADLTQGFICDVVIGRRLLHNADPARGRFRSLLLTSLRNYLREDHRRRRQRKRQPDEQASILDPAQLPALELHDATTPEEAFGLQWSEVLIRGVIEQVRQKCLEEGFDLHWSVFEHRVVRPLLFDDKPTPYRDLVEWLDLKDAAQAVNMMITVKRRFARALYQEVSNTVNDPLQVEGELYELVRDLERQI